ncbi:uncharacterized protein [Pagrus major]|uniref:uncharacterized protein n=1 Tax=Pagrus major TaxID=143350 RepID=UPI003CC85639
MGFSKKENKESKGRHHKHCTTEQTVTDTISKMKLGDEMSPLLTVQGSTSSKLPGLSQRCSLKRKEDRPTFAFPAHGHTFRCDACVTCVIPYKADDMERYAYCESCLTAAREIEKAMKEAPAESRQTVVKSLISGGVCEKMLSYKHDHVSKDKMTSSCMHLLESNHDQFNLALVNKEPKHLDIVLCYEQSTACVGVKRQPFEDSRKSTFTESHIEALLRDNKENVRIARPTHSGSLTHSGEEL